MLTAENIHVNLHHVNEHHDFHLQKELAKMCLQYQLNCQY